MYFWKIKKLKSRLVDQPLSDRESLPYLLVQAVLCLLFISASGLGEGKKPELLDFVSVGVSCLVVFLGTLHLYRMNGGGEGQHLLQRYLAIGWVVGVRCLVLFLFVYIIYGVLRIHSPEVTLWQDVVLGIATSVFYYWRTGVHIRDVSKWDESLQADSESRAELVDLFYQGKNVESLAMDLIEAYTINVDDFDDLFMVYDFPNLTDLSEIAEEEVTDSTSEERIDELTEQYFDNVYESSMAGTKVLVVCVSGKDREVWLAVYLDMHGNPGSVGAYKDRETLISALEAEGRVTT